MSCPHKQSHSARIRIGSPESTCRPYESELERISYAYLRCPYTCGIEYLQS
jgi:hypothetical protein